MCLGHNFTKFEWIYLLGSLESWFLVSKERKRKQSIKVIASIQHMIFLGTLK